MAKFLWEGGTSVFWSVCPMTCSWIILLVFISMCHCDMGAVPSWNSYWGDRPSVCFSTVAADGRLGFDVILMVAHRSESVEFFLEYSSWVDRCGSLLSCLARCRVTILRIFMRGWDGSDLREYSVRVSSEIERKVPTATLLGRRFDGSDCASQCRPFAFAIWYYLICGKGEAHAVAEDVQTKAVSN